MKTIVVSLILALSAVLSVYAQQPQSPTAPIFAVNAKYANGVAPGYAPTAGSGLTLNLGKGTANCLGTLVEYVGGTLTMTNSATNYVSLDPASSCAPVSNTSGFTSSTIWVAKVTASGGVITAIDDVRTGFLAPGTGSGTLTIFSSGNLSPLFTTSVSNSTTTPALSFSLSNATANTLFGNFTASSAAPSFNTINGGSSCGDGTHALNYTNGIGLGCQSISVGTGTITGSGTNHDLAYWTGSSSLGDNTDFTYTTHTLAGGASGIFDLSAETGSAAFKVPSTTTNTASAVGVIDYDSTNGNYHGNSGADSLIGVVPTASVPTNGHILDASVASSKFLLHDSGLVTANVVSASSPGVGLCHFAGSTQSCTSSLVNLTSATDVTGTLPQANIAAETLASGTSVSLSAPSEIYVCTSTCTVTPPVPAAGYEFCVLNGDNVSTVITLAALGSSARYENTARTAYGTAGTGTFVSGGAVKDMVCIVGLDSTHYLTTNSNGTWTAN